MIIDGSPLALIGVFVSILRERYAPGQGIVNYPWYADITKTKITIESAFADSDEHRNFKPAIFIDKEETIYGKVVIGDRAGRNMFTSQDFFWSLATVPILIDCVASRRGESASIGDVVQWTLHSASDIIQGVFGFHSMSPPRLGKTIPYEADKKAWTSPITFQVQYNVRWATVPIAPLLQDIALHITAGAGTSIHFQTVATVASSGLTQYAGQTIVTQIDTE